MTGGMYKPESGREVQEWEELRKAAAMYYPEAKEMANWKVQDCFSLDGIPYIGSYASKRKTPGLHPPKPKMMGEPAEGGNYDL